MKKVFSILILLLAVSSFVSAQGISLGLTGGLTSIAGPEEFTNDIEDGGLGYSSSVHYGVKGKFSLPLIPLKITGQVLYTQFSGEESGTIDAEYEQGLLIVGAGAEYAFVPGPISPYLAFDLFYSNFGETSFKNSALGIATEQTRDGYNRSGIGIGGGLEFGLLPMLDIDVSAKYNINNLIGKEDGEDTFSTINLSATVFLGL